MKSREYLEVDDVTATMGDNDEHQEHSESRGRPGGNRQ
jgi:hypothetical protein